MIYITGDLHGDFSRLGEDVLPVMSEMTEDDYLIVAGDFGFIWDKYSDKELDMISSLGKNILFADGNHENFDIINSLPVTEWNGGKVHRIRDNIIHLMRGQIFSICGKSVFTFGGAFSTDRDLRKAGVSFWVQEMPAKEEYEQALKNLAEHNNSVDIIITHTAPKSAICELGFCPNPDEAELEEFLENIRNKVSYSCWAFGHWHRDRDLGRNTHAVFRDMITAG